MENIEVYWSKIPKEDLDKPIDHKHKTLRGQTIPKDLGRIAGLLVDWQGDVATALGLANVDVAEIRQRHIQSLDLQKREALSKWMASQSQPTPRNLIRAFHDMQLLDCVKAVCTVLGGDETADGASATRTESNTAGQQQPPTLPQCHATDKFSKSMTSEKLKQWLLHKFGEDHIENIKKLRENDVDGSIFLTLTDNVLKTDFSISSWGFRRKLVELIEECCARRPAEEALPDITNHILDEMKWETASGRQEKISIYQQAAHKWRKIATKLGLSTGEINGIDREKRGQERECVRSVFGSWLENAQGMEHHDEYPNSWKGLIALLGDSELSELAKKVQEALKSKFQIEISQI